MLKYLDIYRDPNTRFRVTTWRGGRVVTPLAMAVESTVRALNFPKVLSVLVNNAGINPNAPYVMDDLKKGLRIRTNALTHFLVQWEKYKSPRSSTEVLHTLLSYGADARAPALYEVTPLDVGRVIFEKQRMLCAASGQSLLAFQISLPHDVPPPSNFITDLIQMGHARFLPSDPDGLFVKWARKAWGVDDVIDFLCPSETTLMRRPIADGLLAPGEEASGELRRLVQSFDSQTKMNILHLFVAEGNHYDTNEILKKLRMLRHVYGLSVLTPTLDGRTVTALAEQSHQSFSKQMQEAVAMARNEELLEQRRALAAARGLALRHLPSLAIQMIGNQSGLPLGRAESINEDIDQRRRARESKRIL